MCGPKKRQEFVLLSRDKINGMKESLKKEGTDYLTTNDVVMSACADALGSKNDMLLYPSDLRGRGKDGVTRKLGGNFVYSICLDNEKGRDPNFVRSVVKRNQGYETDAMPKKPWSKLSVTMVRERVF